MRYYKKVLALFCAGLILFGLWGCSGRMDNREDTKTNRLDLPPEHLELSERQREILKKENLPQEYDKLTQTQKRAVRVPSRRFLQQGHRYGASGGL